MENTQEKQTRELLATLDLTDTEHQLQHAEDQLNELVGSLVLLKYGSDHYGDNFPDHLREEAEAYEDQLFSRIHTEIHQALANITDTIIREITTQQ